MENSQHFDAVVIGSGFGGIYMLHKLRDELGLKTRAFEKGGGIGGTHLVGQTQGVFDQLLELFAAVGKAIGLFGGLAGFDGHVVVCE